jgi:hypothetical protein
MIRRSIKPRSALTNSEDDNGVGSIVVRHVMKFLFDDSRDVLFWSPDMKDLFLPRMSSDH